MAAFETIYKIEISNGEYGCGDLGISTIDWIELLKLPEASQYLETLLCFLREPKHAATCSSISRKYGKTSNYYNAKVTNFSKWVKKKLNRFQVLNEDGSVTYWCIAMQKGWETKQGFKWQLRDELVEALRNYLMNDLIAWYYSKEPFNGFDEEYKWALIDKAEGKKTIQIIDIIANEKFDNQYLNLVDIPRAIPSLKYLLEKKHDKLEACANHLVDESKPINDRLADFKNEMKNISPQDWKAIPNDERTASIILMCAYPEKYTAYKDEIYQLICQYFGFEGQKPGNKFCHFITILNQIVDQFGDEVQQLMLPQIGEYKNKPRILAIQTLFWCMKNEIRNKLNSLMQTYWLVGYSYGDNKLLFNRFIEEGFWDCSYDVNKDSDRNQLDETKKISVGDIIVLKSTSTKGPNHDKPFLRVKAIGVVTSEITVTDGGFGKKGCRCSVDYINTNEKDFDGSIYGSYRKTIHRADSRVKEIIDYINEIMSKKTMPQKKYQKYIDLLRESHNLVLTGAPGTGKTYMAQKIAEEMDAITKFVQFHPSYDYTDFVEGLRPIEKEDGQMGFERRDGVFKEFCREAIRNLIDSRKSIESLSNELSWQEQLGLFVDDAIESGEEFETVNGSKFIITDLKGHNIVIHNKLNERTSQVNVNADEILELLTNETPLNIVRDIRNFFKRKFGTQADSYAFVITKAVREMSTKVPVVIANKIDRKPFVFIIDEINRGEASKIFGELFYAIDPGYRGKKEHLVQTQYQNLVPETDVFANGFYVPENVYILATMNDIDRSVESMDFAMRRRFTWQEVTPDDTESMLDSLSCVDKAKDTMHRLNKAIAETDGLGAAYMIGPSYFLKLGENGGDFERLWKMNIEPLLKEYLRGFRKSAEILEKFNKAYFDNNEIATDQPKLIDEN